jgi:hypothetical protein
MSVMLLKSRRDGSSDAETGARWHFSRTRLVRGTTKIGSRDEGEVGGQDAATARIPHQAQHAGKAL